MNIAFALACLVCSCSAFANSNWLTMAGDPLDAGASTIEIDPTSASPLGDRPMRVLRISYPQEHTSSDGVAFRSYRAQVEFDCTYRNARFVSVDFYEQSIWRGQPHKSIAYGPAPVRPVIFRFFEPSLLEKLVQAACHAATSPKN